MSSQSYSFRELAIGEKFIFLSQVLLPYSGMKQGPWEKISARKYKHLSDGSESKVGTVTARVLKVKGNL